MFLTIHVNLAFVSIQQIKIHPCKIQGEPNESYGSRDQELPSGSYQQIRWFSLGKWLSPIEGTKEKRPLGEVYQTQISMQSRNVKKKSKPKFSR